MNWLVIKKAIVAVAAVVFCTLGLSAAVRVELISKAYTNNPIILGDTLAVELSGDGRWALLTVSADNLPRVDATLPSLDLFLRNVATGETKLITRNESGLAANGPSIGLQISADGRFVLFESEANDLVADDTNEVSDIFLYDAVNADLRLISRNGETLGNGESSGATMSPDGQFVVFQSASSNLSPNDTNDVPDLFLYDRQSNILKPVADGLLGGKKRPDFEAKVTPDGRYVAFLSSATNAHPLFRGGDDPQIYLKDMASGEIRWISRQSGGGGAAPYVSHLNLSTNNWVGFISSDLVLGPATLLPSTYIYLVEHREQRYEQISDPTGGELPRQVTEMVMTPDARRIAYVLQYGVGFGRAGLYLYDVASKTNYLLKAGGRLFGVSFSDVAISNDGRIVTFLTMPPTDGPPQLYCYDDQTGVTELLSRKDATKPADGDIFGPALSGDGTTAAFLSLPKNFDINKSRSTLEAFVVPTTVQTPPVAFNLTLAGEGGNTGAGFSKAPRKRNHWAQSAAIGISADGSRVVYESSANNIVPGDDNDRSDIFVTDLRRGTTERLVDSNTNNTRLITASADIATFMTTSASQRLNVYDAVTGGDLLEGVFSNARAGLASSAALSRNGRYALFETGSGLFEPSSIFVRDLWNKTNTRITLPAGFWGSSWEFSSGAKYAFFQQQRPVKAWMTDWRNGTGFWMSSLYVGSTPDDSTLLLMSNVNLSDAGDLALFSPATGSSNVVVTNVTFPAMSLDGSVIMYNQVMPGKPKAAFVLDPASNTRSPLGAKADGTPWSFEQPPSITPDGRYIAFGMKRDNGQQDSDFVDIYRYDRATKELTLVSQTPGGTLPNGPSANASISDDGLTIMFESLASDLVANDRNLDFDVFVAHITEMESASLRVELLGNSISWSAETGRKYQLEFTTDLALKNWAAFGTPVTASSTRVTADIGQGAGGRGFYRVKVVE